MSENTYLVAFKVHSSRREAFIEKLKENSGYCPIHQHCWAIISDKEPVDIVNYLDESLTENDSVIVLKSGLHAAWINAYGEENDEWLKENL